MNSQRHGDLTSPAYWADAHDGARRSANRLTDASESEWLAPCLPLLADYAGRRYLELGCSPGHASSLIYSRIPLAMEGIDCSTAAGLFSENLSNVGHADAKVHLADLRDFFPSEPYDVVASFGLIEHFADPLGILANHARLLATGGLCIVVVPWFRRLQWIFHRAFDADDLALHNLAAMDPRLFREFARTQGLDVLHLGHAGSLRFWWSKDPVGRVKRIALRLTMSAARRLAPHLEPGPLHSPWLVFVGRKRA